MSEPASATVRRLFAAYGEAGPEGVAEWFAPDASFVVSAEMSAEPDVYEGPEGMRRYFAGWAGTVEDMRFDVFEVIDAGPDAAIVVLRSSGVGAASRIPVAQDVILAVRVGGGQVVAMSAHRGVEAARLALDPQSRPDR